MNKQILWFGCAILFTNYSYGEIEFLRTGTFYRSDASQANDGDEWYFLSKKGNISKIKIKVSSKGESHVEGDDYVTIGINDIKMQEDGFLIKGLPLKTGPSKYFKEVGQLKITETSKIFLDGAAPEHKSDYVALVVTGTVRMKTRYLSSAAWLDKYELSYTDGKNSHTFVEIEGVHWLYSITWLGDLNNDGYPDFAAFRVTHDSGSTETKLFLTDKSNGDLKIKEVAVFNTSGC